MSRRLDRPPFILAHPADMAGCGYHRIVRPLSIMSRNGVCASRIDPNLLDTLTLQALRPDVIVFQRQIDDAQTSHMRRYREALPNAFFVYEIDDALSAVPDYSYHAPFMMPNIDSRLKQAISLCDVVTVTTRDLASHMERICEPGTEVRIVPNMLGRDDFEVGEQVRKSSSLMTPPGKLRIGWGGGIGHAGDLEILHTTMRALPEVEWVFHGMDPEIPPGVHKVFTGTSSTERYLHSLAALNVDLMVAPLVDNAFNRSKSNLRLIEAGACRYPVIASPVAPYKTDKPPVFAYAATPEDWIKHIRAFLSASEATRQQSGIAMRDWANSRYNLDTKAVERLQGWLPSKIKAFKPKLNERGTSLTICCTADLPDEVEDVSHDIVKACRDTTNDILYVRPGVHLTQSVLERLVAADGDVVAPLSNDGGPWGFPEYTRHSAVMPEAVVIIDRLCSASTEVADSGAISGPVVLLRRKALGAIGLPDFENLSPEVALLEWSVIAKNRGLKCGVFLGAYVRVDGPSPASPEESNIAARRISGRWPQVKHDDMRLRIYRQELECKFHRDSFTQLPQSNGPINYQMWADQFDTPGPASNELMVNWARSAESLHTIRIIRHSELAAFCAEEQTTADFYVIAPDEAELALNLSGRILEAVQSHPEALIFYADHDFLSQGQRVGPDFKPNFDFHFLLGRDYVTQVIIIPEVNIDALRAECILTNSKSAPLQLYSFVLRAFLNFGKGSIAHIPHILAHLQPDPMDRAIELSNQLSLITQELLRQFGIPIDVIQHPTLPPYRDISYARATTGLHPKHVTIIVPTKNNLEMLAPCLQTILTRTTYKHFNVMVIDNNTTRGEHLAYLSNINDPRVTVHRWPHEYNWSALNNWATQQPEAAKADAFVFLNDDTRVMAADWLTEMLGASLIPGVGTVGARLIYPHGGIQHIGVVASAGMSGHMHKGLISSNPGVNGIAALSHEATAVTGACILISRPIFESLGSFDETLPTNFNDVAFCREVMRRGMVNVVAMRAELQHFEGVTRNPNSIDDKAAMEIRRDGTRLAELYPEADPYWNPNLLFVSVYNGMAVDGMNMTTYAVPPPAPWGVPKARRILVHGPVNAVLEERHDGAALYHLDITGNIVRIVSPPMVNTGPWDLRNLESITAALVHLDLDSIVISSIGDAPLQSLALFQHIGAVLNVPVVYRPIEAEMVCPRRDFTRNGSSCDSGYLRQGECQSCIDTNGCSHGYIGMIAWRTEFLRFTSSPGVEFDPSALRDTSHENAIRTLFGDEQPTAQAAE